MSKIQKGILINFEDVINRDIEKELSHIRGM